MMDRFNKLLDEIKDNLKFSVRDWFRFLFWMIIAIYTAGVLRFAEFGNSDVFTPMIFVLAVLIISYQTEGFVFGILAAIAGVLAVNWAFTFPYYEVNFTGYGYPITFITMFAVCIVTSLLTARLKTQEKLKHDNEKEKMRSNLLRAMSHDIRTPLTSISGSISTVLDESDMLTDEQKRELLEGAKEDSEWLCRMVENLLSITRINNSADNTIEKNDELLEEVLSAVVGKFRKKNPNVKVNIELPDDEVFIPMDAMLIQQLFTNLLENAVIHGKSVTEISIIVVYEEKIVKVWVYDNGGGIDPEILPKMFDGSLQEYTGDSNKFMGIGLLVCKTIVLAHGGEIYAGNMEDGGACISFTLSLEETENGNQRKNTDN